MAETARKPAIRFAGFNDAWEQRKLGDFGSVAMCKRIFKHQTSEKGDVPFFKIGTFGGTPDAFITRELFEEYKAKYQYPEIGDILVSASGSIGRTVVFTGKNEYFQDSNIVWLKHDNNIFNPFLRHLYEVVEWAGIEGSTIKRLYNDIILKTEVVIPSVPEQVAIAEILDGVDNLITLHQRKYDKLVTVKKSMLEKMFPKNGSRYPEIRFKGFSDAWEQRKLGDTFNFLQNNTLSRADLDAKTGAAKNVHYGDVLIKFGEYLDASGTDLPYIPSQQIVDKFKGSLLQDGDVIMADTAEDEAVGKCTEITKLQGFPTISGLHTIPLRPKEKFASGYLGYYMNSNSYHDQLLPLMQGIKVTSVSKSAITNTDISYPADSDEQALIGGFFIHLDNLITLHQRELEKLKNIKKSMLEKMFV